MPRGRAPTKKTRSFGALKASVKPSGIATVSTSPRSSQMASVDRVQKLMDDKGYSMDRAVRNQFQKDLIQQFKDTQMKPVEGSSNLLQKVDPTGMDLTEYRNMVTNKYGPTLGEVGGDIVRGLGSIAGGIGNFVGGGGILGAILNAIGGAKNLGSKGLGFLQNLFSTGPRQVSDVAMGPRATADDIAEAEVLAQIAGGSPTLDALSGKTYTDLYGGNKDYSSFINLPPYDSGINTLVRETSLVGDGRPPVYDYNEIPPTYTQGEYPGFIYDYGEIPMSRPDKVILTNL